MTKNKNQSKDINVRENFFMLLRMTFKIHYKSILLQIPQTVFGRACFFLTHTYLLGYVINGIQEGKPFKNIFSYILGVTVLNILSQMISFFYYNYLMAIIDKKENAKLNKMIRERTLRLDLSNYESPEMYTLYSRAVTSGAGTLSEMASEIIMIFPNLFTLCASLWLVLKTAPMLIVFCLPGIIFDLALIERFIKKKRSIDVKNAEVYRKQSYAQRVFYQREYAKEMRLTNIAQVIFRDFRRHTEKLFQILKKESLPFLLKRSVISFVFSNIPSLAANIYMAYHVLISGTMPLGNYFIANNLRHELSASIEQTVKKYSSVYELCLKFQDFRDFLEHRDRIQPNENGIEARPGDIELRGVTFRYHGATEDTLRGIDLRIKQGEHITIVGYNGAGKTTLVKLLMRLYDADSGEITLDGVNVADLRLESYRACFGTVFQDYKQFAFTVAENVLCRPFREGDEELVISSLRKAGLWDKISTLPSGIHTRMTREFDEDGLLLSGGESQKLAIASIYARNCSVVILDEPSSALDPLAEHEMYRSIYKACEGKTVIFISHRLSSATESDRVLLMENGRITEQGSHDALMRLGGRYAEMFRMQAEAYNL